MTTDGCYLAEVTAEARQLKKAEKLPDWTIPEINEAADMCVSQANEQARRARSSVIVGVEEFVFLRMIAKAKEPDERFVEELQRRLPGAKIEFVPLRHWALATFFYFFSCGTIHSTAYRIDWSEQKK